MPIADERTSDAPGDCAGVANAAVQVVARKTGSADRVGGRTRGTVAGTGQAEERVRSEHVPCPAGGDDGGARAGRGSGGAIAAGGSIGG